MKKLHYRAASKLPMAVLIVTLFSAVCANAQHDEMKKDPDVIGRWDTRWKKTAKTSHHG
jgi:hypothetical protein